MAVIERIVVPRENVNDDIVTIVNVSAASFQKVDKGQPLFTLQTAKATFDVASPAFGYVEILCTPGQELPVGSILGVVHDTANSPGISPSPNVSFSDAAGPVFSEKAKRLLAETGGSAEGFASYDFVRAADISPATEAHCQENSKDQVVPGLKPVQDFESTPLSAYKKSEVRNLSAGANQLLSTIFMKVRFNVNASNTTGTDVFGNIRNDFVPHIIQITARLLQKYSEFNGFFKEGKFCHYFKVVVGYALDLGEGIRVVSYRNIEKESIENIRNMTIQYVKKYIRNSFRPDELSGSTFTVTDLSSEGVFFFVPLINAFQSAALGIGAPDASDKSITLCLTFDHRIGSGRLAAQFLKEIKSMVESLYINIL